jgi:RNA polymerase sigma-70 factor (ECF subfamily)
VLTTAAPPPAIDPAEEEAALMARVADGDDGAFAALYDRHARAVHSYALSLVGGAAEAEDVCQEAFLALWRHAGRFDPRRGSARGWLIGIARHRAIDRLRAQAGLARARRAAGAVAALAGADDPVARAGVDRAEAARAGRALGDLPPEQREVLLLVHLAGLTQREIAAVTGLPLGTVKGRLRLGLERLRREAGVPAAG